MSEKKKLAVVPLEEIPKTCLDCPLHSKSGYANFPWKCAVKGTRITEPKTRRDDCPIVEVVVDAD